MSLLLKIAKRQIRKNELSDGQIIDLIRQADQLLLEQIPANTTAGTILDRAKKECSREVVRARRTVFQALIAGVHEVRQDLFDSVVAALLNEHPEWDENGYAILLAGDCRRELDAALEGQPVEVFTRAGESRLPCNVCNVTMCGEKYLSLETFTVIPMCSECSREQTKEVLNGKI